MCMYVKFSILNCFVFVSNVISAIVIICLFVFGCMCEITCALPNEVIFHCMFCLLTIVTGIVVVMLFENAHLNKTFPLVRNNDFSTFVFWSLFADQNRPVGSICMMPIDK